jgi:hypothetical protein
MYYPCYILKFDIVHWFWLVHWFTGSLVSLQYLKWFNQFGTLARKFPRKRPMN